MGEIDKLLKLTKRSLPPLPRLAKLVIETLLMKTEREFLELLTNEEELKNLVLEVTNQPQFRKDNPPVEDIRKALLILGEDFVKILILGYISKKLQKNTFNEFNCKLFWARAIANLCFSHLLFDYFENYPSHLHISSYLMDFGVLLLYFIHPEGYLKVLKLKKLGKTVCEAEREVFGVDHSIVGGEYFENFSFPRRFVLDIYYHHRLSALPEEIPQEVFQDIKFLNLIDLGVGSYFSDERELKYNAYKEFAQTNFNLDPVQADSFVENLPSFLNQFFEILDYKEFTLIPYSKWLKERDKKLKEALAKLEEQKKADKEAIVDFKAKIAKLIRERELLVKQLSELERKLKTSSILDPLTNVYNQEYFIRRLREELLRAKRYGRLVSILLVEIEKLSELTQMFGAKEEETALKLLAESISQHLRRVDIVAKLNHPERFGIILPETPMQGAMVVARKLNRMIEKFFNVKYRINKLPFITVVTYDPSKLNPKTDPHAEAILKILEKGIDILKEKGQKRILCLLIDKELENNKG